MLPKRLAALLLCALLWLPAAPACAAPAWPAGDPEIVIRRVLQQPGYRTVKTSSAAPRRNPIEEALHWIWERFTGALSAVRKALRGARGAGAAFGIMLLIALLSLLVLLIARIVAYFVYSRVERDAPVQELFVPSLPASTWLERARAAAERGEFAGAVAAVFNASLRLLDEHGLVPYDDARTPLEYRALVRSADAGQAGAFDIIAARFVSATFSRSRAGSSDYDDALRAYGSLAAGAAR